MRKDTHKLLVSYLDSLSPIIYIHHSDFPAIDDELRSITEEYHVKFAEFNNALGAIDFNTKHSLHKCELPEFLESVFDMNNDDEPFELESFITLIDVPLPDDEEIRECINSANS